MLRPRPAVFVLVESPTAPARSFVAAWGGDRVDRDLAFGPGPTLSMLQKLDEREPARWPIEEELIGGVVIDSVERRIRLFGGDDAMRLDPRVRAVRLELLAAAWEGWDVGFAGHGVAELADAAGVARERVLTPLDELPYDVPQPPFFDGRLESFVTVLRDGDVTLHPFGWDPVELILWGPELVEALAVESGGGPYALAGPPHGGLVIDADRHVVDFWLSEPLADAAPRASRRWGGGWAARYHGDDFSRQVDASRGLIRLDPFDRREAVRLATERLMGQGHDVDALFDEVRARLDANQPVAIDPSRAPQDLAPLERAWILGRALASVGG